MNEQRNQRSRKIYSQSGGTDAALTARVPTKRHFKRWLVSVTPKFNNIITKEVEVCAFSNPDYYRSKGYCIEKIYNPKTKKSHVPRRLKIKVLVSDLPPLCSAKIKYKCDKCGAEVETAYCNLHYKKTSYCKLCGLSSTHTGRTKIISEQTRQKLIEVHNRIKKVGENHPLFKREKSSDQRLADRKLPENMDFVRLCLKRDNYTCQKCLHVGAKLQVHHIVPYSKDFALRFDINNGITLCISCHKKYHKIYGIKNANRKNFNQFINHEQLSN